MKKILLVIFTLVSLSAFAQTNGDIVDRLNAKLGVRLPAEYEANNLYQKTPQVERKIETKHYIDYIETCKENNIDYKAILRKELGDDKKVQELLKFYGVE